MCILTLGSIKTFWIVHLSIKKHKNILEMISKRLEIILLRKNVFLCKTRAYVSTHTLYESTHVVKFLSL